MYKKFAAQGDNMFWKNSLLNQKFQKLLYKRIFGSPFHFSDLIFIFTNIKKYFDE